MRVVEHLGLTLVAFPPAQLGLYVDTLDANKARPHTAAAALARAPGVAAVLDGPMFAVVDRAHPRYRDYQAAGLCYRYLDRVASIDHDGGTHTDGRGLTLSVGADGVHVANGDAPAPGSLVAVQLYPTLVRSMAVVASPRVNADRVWRAGAGILDTGEAFLAVERATMFDFASHLRAAGALDAGYSDGGGSTRLTLRDGRSWGSSENRRVASFLVVRDA